MSERSLGVAPLPAATNDSRASATPPERQDYPLQAAKIIAAVELDPPGLLWVEFSGSAAVFRNAAYIVATGRGATPGGPVKKAEGKTLRPFT